MSPHEPVDPQEQADVKQYVIEEYSAGRMTYNAAWTQLFSWHFQVKEIETLLETHKPKG